MKSITVVLLVLAAVLFDGRADGIPFHRYRKSRVAVPATVLALTKEQLSSLTSSNRFIALTTEQRVRLQRHTSYIPEQLQVYPLEEARETCTCEVLNMGIRYTKTEIEVPHGLLGRSLADRKLWR